MKDKKNLIIIILSIVVVILLVLLAFMLGLNAGKNTTGNSDSVVKATEEPAGPIETEVPEVSNTPAPTQAPEETPVPQATEAPTVTDAPTPTAEPIASEIPATPDEELPADAFILDINTDDTWGESPKYYRMNMVLTNNTDAGINGWTLRVKVGEGTAIDSGWRGKYSLDGDTLIVTNEDHNAKIPAGGSIDFGLIISDLSGDLSYTVEPKY